MSLANVVKYYIAHDISEKQDRYQGSGDANRLETMGED